MLRAWRILFAAPSVAALSQAQSICI